MRRDSINNGALLKYYRLKRNLSQEEVADSLVSTSYLSRIENNQVTPANETLILLFERVGKNIEEVQAHSTSFSSLLESWEEPLLKNQKKEAEDVKNDLDVAIEEVMDIELILEYHIKNIRYHIIKGEYDSAYNSVNLVEGLHEFINAKSLFFFYKHLGNYYLVMNKVDKSEEALRRAISIYSSSKYNEVEKADLYYLFSLCLSKIRKDAIGLDYALISLEIYKNHYLLKNCAQTHIQIGVSYSRIKHYESSLKHYKVALDLAQQARLDQLLGTIEHNIANLKLKNGKEEEAINYLYSALENKKNNNNTSYFQSLILLLSIYYGQNNISIIQELTSQGEKILKKSNKTEECKYEIVFYKKAISSQVDKWEGYVDNELIPHFKNEQKWYHLIKYSKIMASHYKQKSHYKKATYYYQIIIDAYDSLYNY